MNKPLPRCIDPESIIPISRFTTEVFKTGAWDSRRPQFTEKLSPCRVACPAGNDIPSAFHRASEGDFDAALSLFLKESPLPGVCGRVCYHPCQTDCNREKWDGTVQIRALERSASELGTIEPEPLTDAGKGQPVAVIGSGPAGLSAAYHLARMGHPVTLLEAEKKLGGVLHTAIPAYRLPEDALDKDLSRILPLIDTVRTGVDVNASMLRDLLNDFRSVFLAVGAARSRRLEIPGSRLPGIESAVAFLRRARKKQQPSIQGSVVVVGGGDVALDAAISARRLGAESVEVVCLEQEEDMPASDILKQDAQKAGIRFHFGWGVLRFTERNHRVSGAVFGRCTSFCMEQGEIIPALDKDECMERPADHVMVAIGEAVHLGPLADGIADLPEHGHVQTDPVTLATGIPGLYAGGDAVKTPGSVAEAIGTGKRAAFHIHLNLNAAIYDRSVEDALLADGPGFSIEAFFRNRSHWDHKRMVRFEDLNPFCLISHPPEPIQHRAGAKGFEEEIRSFSRDQAVSEAGRCFYCGTCIGCERCILFCPDLSIHPVNGERRIYGPSEDYCKGCGTCAAACIRGVMELGESR